MFRYYLIVAAILLGIPAISWSEPSVGNETTKTDSSRWQEETMAFRPFSTLQTSADNSRGLAATHGIGHDKATDFVDAERAVLQIMKDWGVSLDGSRIAYHDLGRVLGGQRGNTEEIAVNPHRYPESLESIFHESWHVVQGKLWGLDAFAQAYENQNRPRHGYLTNPFETEARFVGKLLHKVWTQNRSAPTEHLGQLAATGLARDWTGLVYSWDCYRTVLRPHHHGRIKSALQGLGADPYKLDVITNAAKSGRVGVISPKTGRVHSVPILQRRAAPK